jgi:hypothetical protein
LPQPANPTIDHVFEEFLADQRERLKPRTLSRYEDVLDLLRHHLNGYAYEGLSKSESALFEKHYDAEGDGHREFCQLFGPGKIVENLGGFLGYFMIRKVLAGQDLKRAAGSVTKKLSKWLATKGYIADDEAQDGADRGSEAARELPQAEKATGILYEAAAYLAIDPDGLADEDYLEFDHYTIGKVEPGELWLEHWAGGKTRLCGPIPVPHTATKLLQQGWDISCALGRIRGKWQIVEAGNVYPL